MVWGEVNYGANFQPMPEHSPVGPRTYAQLCDLAYVALKRASPANIVIGGDTLNANIPVSPAEFIRWARVGKGKKKRPPRLDWWGHNPFEGRFPDIRQPALNSLLGLSDADDSQAAEERPGKKKQGKEGDRPARLRRRASWARRHTRPSGQAACSPGPPTSGSATSRQEQAQWVSSAYQLVNSVRTWRAWVGTARRRAGRRRQRQLGPAHLLRQRKASFGATRPRRSARQLRARLRSDHLPAGLLHLGNIGSETARRQSVRDWQIRATASVEPKR
jgi:hypothetical protein